MSLTVLYCCAMQGPPETTFISLWGEDKSKNFPVWLARSLLSSESPSILTPLHSACAHLLVSPASTFLKQAFEGEYPKLLRLYNELWRRLQQYSASLQGLVANGVGMEASVDITGAEMDSQDLFTHGKQDYKWADTETATQSFHSVVTHTICRMSGWS